MTETAASSSGADATVAADARRRSAVLLAATFVIAASGLAYELVAGASASYLLGDSVTQWSLVVGLFMTAMGLGAWLSRYVEDPVGGFCRAQIALGLIGGASAPIFFFAWLHVEPFSVVLFAVVIATGALSGLEIPLIVRVLEGLGATRHTLSTVLTLDYVGALAAALAFPLLIAPWLGLMSASLLFGLLNLGVAVLAISALRPAGRSRLMAAAAGAVVALGLALANGERLIAAAEAGLYDDEIVYADQTPYQRIVVTRFRDRVRLFLDGSIQFDSRDEHRYHEALVHPAMTRALRVDRVLVLGGGDGMAAREVLRYADVREVVLVDLDPAVVALFQDGPLSELNDGALRDPRLTVVSADAFSWAEAASRAGAEPYDVIIADLPDPRTTALSKLYTRAFYTSVTDLLSAGGVFAAQAGAPYFAREAFWSVISTLETVRDPFEPGQTLVATPYSVWAPSFGLWGFALVGPASDVSPRRSPPSDLQMYSPDQWAGMTYFPTDVARLDVSPNTMRDHALLRYYEAGWRALD